MNNSHRRAGVCIALVLGAGCLVQACQTRDETSAAPGPAAETPRLMSVQERLKLGEEVYASSCAACHETGTGGAPKTGDRTAWSERSPLWVAVLSEHAKKGYLEMPGKGGDETLSDDGVAAATEHMLSKTFPELPVSE